MVFIAIFLESRIADIFVNVFLITSFILGISAFFSIRRNNLRGIVCAVVCCGLSTLLLLLAVTSVFFRVHIFLSNRADRVYRLEQIGKRITIYAESHDGHLPAADQWCDLLLENDKGISIDFFCLKKNVPNTAKCDFAFNNNLSSLILSEIPGDVVLVFESHGKWNLSGSEELLYETNINREVAYLLLVNGDIERYIPQLNHRKGQIGTYPFKWKLGAKGVMP
jgi:hypothetical protein